MNEFSLIDQYFSNCNHTRYPATHSIGDDAAIVTPEFGSSLVMTMDTLIEDVHFPIQTSAKDIAHKALAVNLSDLAAMGAEPAWFLLSISLPEVNHTWLQAFSDALKQQADLYQIQLIGGDTCKGALSITIQATGVVQNRPVLRSGAEVGDQIFVTGQLGLAALGLASIQNKLELESSFDKQCRVSLNCPIPQFKVSRVIRQFATSMIDLSDGLLSDLQHILQQSQCGAELFLDQIPMPKYIVEHKVYDYALNSGDDYELCFTVPQPLIEEMKLLLKVHEIKVFHIGEVMEKGLSLYSDKTRKMKLDIHASKGYNHFG